MTELSEAMERLINNWNMTVTVGEGERVQGFPPLVDMLHGQLVPGMEGTGGGGAPSTRNVLDLGSLDLLMNIQDVTRAWLQEWGVPSAGELKLDLRAFWDRLHALHQAGGLDATMYDHLAAYPDAWAARVWDLIEPPKRVTLRGTECPRCGEAKTANLEGDLSDALTVTFRVGHEPTAECGALECGAVWIGLSGLIDLGRAVGVEIDVDTLSKLAGSVLE